MDFNKQDIQAFQHALLTWYANHSRDLPWRNTADPYHIWISEIMLQQTRVDQARPYFERFVTAFPDIHTLAQAPLDDVLLNWEGLGYYSRARNLHRAAKRIVDTHQGRLPEEHDLLLALPGIGPYTAAAIMSIAFSKPFGVLDGNVMRVLTRLTCTDSDITSAKTKRTLQDYSNTLVDPNKPGDFNQAMMELGATQCTPRNAGCQDCPVQAFCCAHKTDSVDLFPVKKKKNPVPHHNMVACIVQNPKGEILIQQRPQDQMLGGLWEFPGRRLDPEEPIEEACKQYFESEFGLTLQLGAPIKPVLHAYSHFKITVYALICQTESAADQPSLQRPHLRWEFPSNLENYAFHRAHRILADRYQEHIKSPSLFDSNNGFPK